MSPVVNKPAPLDVLCGQDATYAKNQGNKVLRQQIELALDAYIKATDRREKIAKIDEIISFMRTNYNARFLRWCQGRCVWEEVSEQSVRDKVSHSLRFASKRRNKKNKKAHRRIQNKPITLKSSKTRQETASEPVELKAVRCERRVSLATLHERQQKILQKMLHEVYEETDRDSPCFPVCQSSTHNVVDIDSDSSLEERLRKELDTIEPIPLHSNFKIDSGKCSLTEDDPVHVVSRSPSSEDDTFPLSACSVETIPLKLVTSREMLSFCQSFDDVCPKTIETASVSTRSGFSLRSDNHFDRHRCNPPPNYSYADFWFHENSLGFSNSY